MESFSATTRSEQWSARQRWLMAHREYSILNASGFRGFDIHIVESHSCSTDNSQFSCRLNHAGIDLRSATDNNDLVIRDQLYKPGSVNTCLIIDLQACGSENFQSIRMNRVANENSHLSSSPRS